MRKPARDKFMRKEADISKACSDFRDPSSRATRRKRCSAGCGWDPRPSSRVEMGMSENFLTCSKGVKDPFEVPEVSCD